MRCVFFGSPEFALGSLEALLASKHQVVGVITQPDRPSGRGLKLEPPAVKKRALEANLPIHQPEKLNHESTYAFLDSLNPDILVVVAYGGFLGSKLLSYCQYPPVNVHPSLLPDLRGAAPVPWALLRGHQKTGITTQYMVKEMDAGDVLLQEEHELNENDNARDLLARFSVDGGRLLVRTLDFIESGSINPRPQDPALATFAPLLTKEQGLLRFDANDAWTLHNQVRGLFPWPGAYTFVNKKRVKVLRSQMARSESSLGAAGSFWFREDRMFVACREGVLELLEVQPEGKKAQLPQEFANGMKGISHFDSGE